MTPSARTSGGELCWPCYVRASTHRAADGVVCTSHLPTCPFDENPLNNLIAQPGTCAARCETRETQHMAVQYKGGVQYMTDLNFRVQIQVPYARYKLT